MIPDEIYGALLSAVSNVGADITSDCEQFLSALRTDFNGTDNAFVEYVRANIRGWFRAVGAYPEWIQNADWQFHKGKPMLFVGDIEIPKSAGLYHDDACVYVFLSEDGVTTSVVQIA